MKFTTNKKLKENFTITVYAIFSIFSFAPGWSFFSMAFFIFNFFYLKKFVRISFIFFTASTITGILYFTHLKPMSDKLEKFWSIGYNEGWNDMVKNNLKFINKKIIEYKKTNGEYPPSIHVLNTVTDPSRDLSYVISKEKGNIEFAEYYYEKIDENKYYLLSIGADGLPKTDDDILPEIDSADINKTGLMKFKIK